MIRIRNTRSIKILQEGRKVISSVQMLHENTTRVLLRHKEKEKRLIETQAYFSNFPKLLAEY